MSIRLRTIFLAECPFCRKARGHKGLPRLGDFSEPLVSEWHPTKNGKLTPNNVSKGSSKRVWWQCLKDPTHEWEATVTSRTQHQKGCPICSGFYPSETNSLQAKFPELAQEWHAEKNGDLTPGDIKAGSGQKVWWQCQTHPEHVWQAQVKNRTILNSGCPYCSRENASQEFSDALVDSVSSNTDFYRTFSESIKNLEDLLNIELENSRRG